MRNLRICSAGLVFVVAISATLQSRQAEQSPLVMPANGTGRVPAAIVIADRGLADAVRAEGIATTVVDGSVPAAVAAITAVRNDVRAITVTVIGPGAVAMDAARTARADAVWSTAGGTPGVESAVIKSTAATSTDAKAIAAWIRALTPIRHPTTQRASLRDTTVVEIGDTRITIEYGRPSKRGRMIWGALVPWGRWWMPGADESTVITNSKPIRIGTLDVPAGEHTLYTMPSDGEFMLIINNVVGQFHTEYAPNRDLGRVVMTKVATVEPMERMAFMLTPASTGAVLKLVWDDREYSVPVTVR